LLYYLLHKNQFSKSNQIESEWSLDDPLSKCVLQPCPQMATISKNDLRFFYSETIDPNGKKTKKTWIGMVYE